MSVLKGWLGEKLVQFGMWMNIDSQAYQRLHNVVIPSSNGPTQIDHILVSIYGVFVIETKNMKGWIFGEEKSSSWMQTIHGKKYPFQNPLHQNYRHTQCLAGFLQFDSTVFHSVVFFIGDAVFKSPMPDNVRSGGLSKYIKSFTAPLLTPDEVTKILGRLASTKSDPSLTKRKHLHSLKARFSSTTVCPKCSGNLVERSAKTGRNAGNKFLGCSHYPSCKFTRAVG